MAGRRVVMSFGGRGRGQGRGRGFGGRGGGRGGKRGGRFQQQNYGPPEYVMGEYIGVALHVCMTVTPPLSVEVGCFMHPCEEDLVCKSSIEKVPYFNAPIYLENKSQIGKVDEIFGPMNGYVCIQMSI